MKSELLVLKSNCKTMENERNDYAVQLQELKQDLVSFEKYKTFYLQ